jgi:hypothetical protein
MAWRVAVRWTTRPQREGEWRSWFAWFPVLVAEEDGRRHWAWLERVDRMYRPEDHDFGSMTVWTYRPLGGDDRA